MHSTSASAPPLLQPLPRPEPPADRSGRTVLLVAAEPQLRELLLLHLRAAGCFVMAAASVAEGRRLAAHVVPDLVLLDADGLSAADRRWALQQTDDSQAPVPAALLHTPPLPPPAADSPLAALQVAKPIHPRALMQQLLQLLRPGGAEHRARRRPPAAAGVLQIDGERPILRLRRPEGWAEVDLPRTEHRLLACLLAEPGRARSRQDIRDSVWAGGAVGLRTVDQYVRRLRRSLAGAGAPGLVQTVNGLGYRLDLAALARPAG